MKDVNVVLGERIRLGRKANGITREKLAEQIDVSPRFLAEVEAGKVGMALQTLKNISVALGVTADYLLGLENESRTGRRDILCTQIQCVDEKYLPLISSVIAEVKNIK